MPSGLAWTDYIVGAALSSDSQVTSLPALNAGTDTLSQIWRSTANSAYLQADLGASKSIDLVALLNINITATDTRRVRVSENSDMSAPAYDSTAAVPGGDLSTVRAQLVHRLATPASGRYVRVDIAASAPIEAGRMVVTLLTSPGRAYSHGWQWTLQSRSRKSRAEDGTLYTSRRQPLRGIRLSFEGLTRAEAKGAIWQMLQTAETGGNIVFVSDTASATMGFDTLWGTLEGDMPIGFEHYDIIRLSLDIVERR